MDLVDIVLCQHSSGRGVETGESYKSSFLSRHEFSSGHFDSPELKLFIAMNCQCFRCLFGEIFGPAQIVFICQ